MRYIVDIDNETVYNYLSKLESAFILHRCSRYDLQGKEILKTQEKFYIADPAMRYSVLGYSPDSVAAMLENVIYLELQRQGYEVYIDQLSDGEIDFVATRGGDKLYIQVTQEIQSEKLSSASMKDFWGWKTTTPNIYSAQMNLQAGTMQE